MSSTNNVAQLEANAAQAIAAAVTIFIAIIIPVSIYVSILVPHWCDFRRHGTSPLSVLISRSHFLPFANRRFPCWYNRQEKWLGSDALGESSSVHGGDEPKLASSTSTLPAELLSESSRPETSSRQQPATLTFSDVTYSVPRRKQSDLLILKGVSGVLPSGSLTAIMGPSGCGKSTLLDVLADCKGSGVISGDIRLNGMPRDARTFRTAAAYVMQSDSTHTVLTVRETLNFAAELRLPGSMRRSARLARVQETLADTDLLHVADTRIGDDVSGGLSGGQRRRVTVAIELINRPRLLFLDEPTSGLDAYGALQVVGALRKFGDRGQTIACTIHQPRSDIFKLFDQLLLMSAGETMYFGPIDNIYPYFRSVGVPCDTNVNPADFIVDLTHSPEEEEEEGGSGGEEEGEEEPHAAEKRPPSVAELVVLFKKSHLHTDMHGMIRSVIIDGRSEASASKASGIGGSKSSSSLGGNGDGNGLSSSSSPSLFHVVHEGRAARLHIGRNRVGGGGGGGKYANTFWRQVRVLVRRMYVVDSRNAAYVIAWPLNCFVLFLQGMTYIVIVQPPTTSRTLASYRADFLSAGTCNLPPDPDHSLNGDMKACGEALSTQAGVDYAHAALLFMVLNALFVNELMYVGPDDRTRTVPPLSTPHGNALHSL